MSEEEFANIIKTIVEDLAMDAVSRSGDVPDGGKAPRKGKAVQEW